MLGSCVALNTNLYWKLFLRNVNVIGCWSHLNKGGKTQSALVYRLTIINATKTYRTKLTWLKRGMLLASKFQRKGNRERLCGWIPKVNLHCSKFKVAKFHYIQWFTPSPWHPYVPIKSKIAHPPHPGKPSGIWTFQFLWLNFPPRGQISIQMPHVKNEFRGQMPHLRSPLTDIINNKLLWARKYARIVVRGYYLFREANSELRGTDNVQGQLFVYISEAKSSLLSLLSFEYFLSQRISSGTKQNKTGNKTRRLLGASLALLSQQFS